MTIGVFDVKVDTKCKIASQHERVGLIKQKNESFSYAAVYCILKKLPNIYTSLDFHQLVTKENKRLVQKYQTTRLKVLRRKLSVEKPGQIIIRAICLANAGGTVVSYPGTVRRDPRVDGSFIQASSTASKRHNSDLNNA